MNVLIIIVHQNDENDYGMLRSSNRSIDRDGCIEGIDDETTSRREEEQTSSIDSNVLLVIECCYP